MMMVLVGMNEEEQEDSTRTTLNAERAVKRDDT